MCIPETASETEKLIHPSLSLVTWSTQDLLVISLVAEFLEAVSYEKDYQFVGLPDFCFQRFKISKDETTSSMVMGCSLAKFCPSFFIPTPGLICTLYSHGGGGL